MRVLIRDKTGKETPLPENPGAWLARERRDKGLSLTAIGAAIGVSKQSVSAWEQGEAEPSVEHQIALMQLFAMTTFNASPSTMSLSSKIQAALAEIDVLYALA